MPGITTQMIERLPTQNGHVPLADHWKNMKIFVCVPTLDPFPLDGQTPELALAILYIFGLFDPALFHLMTTTSFLCSI